METVLYRSDNDRMLGGVCGGLAKYIGVDSTFVRIFFALLALGSGLGFLIYRALWIVVPSKSQTTAGTTWKENFKDSTQNLSERAQTVGTEFGQAIRQPRPQAGLIVGVALIAFGALLFVEKLGISWLWWFDFDILWPVLLILGGGVLIFRRKQRA